MNPADEIATKIEPTKRRSAAEEGSDERLRALLEKLHGSDDKLNEQLKDFRGVSLQPGEVLDNLIPRVSRLDDTSVRVRAMESRTKRRSSRGFARFLVAICIGVAGTLAWQSYGEATKQIIATRAPELGWSPESKQMIASGIQQLGWTKAGPENTAPQQTVAPQASTAPPLDPAQVQQMVQSLAALRESVQQLAVGQESLAVLAKTVDRLAAAQDQMARAIDRLQAADQEILVKMPQPPPPPPIAAAPAVAGRPAPGGSRPSENTQNTAPTSASLALRASCGPDVQRLCRGISIENGDVIKCLSSHRMELSPTCDAYFKEMPVDRAAQKGAPTPPSSRAPVPPRQ